ncbi:T-lymphocyte surface antigen Ly-9-like isoform X2 [Xiphophorus hellerii]|uniref:T-lymphocyte surface antigen Ly-9-like isoform X2 n=1 Tax=Xiphophorus hellerii TaxID=8084 RepID=UPI0013B4489F|nr:T-lymphocyte surface antigen Ly-9-like isoform X2 [Xiphophorus hellerii]
MMFLFLMLALLINNEPGIDAFTSVFVRTGGDVFLNVSEADVPNDYHLLLWKFVTDDVLVSFFPNGKLNVRRAYGGRIDVLAKKYSIKLKNLQKSDSGLYTAIVTAASEEVLAQYNVTVQDPVGPVDLTVDSVSSDSSSFTATCTADGTDISSTFRCTAKTCLQEGGEGSKVTKSGAALLVCLSRSAVVCNHSNQVSWMEKTAEIDHLCLKNAGPDEPHGFSICYVKKVVFSVGLIVMVLVVIAVHLKEKFNKHK